MTDLGEVRSILGINIQRNRIERTISIDQTAYIENILHRFRMSDCKPVKTPVDPNVKLTKNIGNIQDELKKLYQQAIGSLMYAMLGTRPDIAYAVSLVSRYCANPDNAHWTAVKRIFRYLRGTTNFKLVYDGNNSQELHGFSDADWAGDRDDWRSTTGYVFICRTPPSRGTAKNNRL